MFTGSSGADHAQQAEHIFDAIVEQGARLPSQRRYAARTISMATGSIQINTALLADNRALMT